MPDRPESKSEENLENSWNQLAQNGSAALRLGRIIAPVNLSSYDLPALECASRLARHFDAKLILLHVFDPASGSLQRHETRMRLEQMCSGIKRSYPNANLSLRVGIPHSEITEAAKELRADLIVISIHHKGLLERIIFGEEASKVVREASCPVLVVHDEVAAKE